jgi:alpha-L-arabinofuranosidase
MPALTTGNMVALMARLRPGMIRYPGGTVTHGWDWQQGRMPSRPSSQVHPIIDVKTLSDALGAQVVVVLDIVNSSLENQMAMLRELRKIGVAFRHVELGNEIYAQDEVYAARFPTGADYGAEANRWAAAVKAEFRDVQVAALLFAREVGPANVRGQNWNTDILGGPTNNIDAWTFHIYIPEGGTAASVMENYRSVSGALPLGGKPIWITEYGNKNETAADYIPELLALADLVQAQSGVTIALNHQMIGGEKNKMALDALELNAEGVAFVRRVGG